MTAQVTVYWFCFKPPQSYSRLVRSSYTSFSKYVSFHHVDIIQQERELGPDHGQPEGTGAIKVPVRVGPGQQACHDT